MASVTGSRLAFFAPGVDGSNINVVLNGGIGPVAPVAGKFNIEVFTSAAGGLTPGFQASAFIQGAIQLSNNLIQAGTINSTEQLLNGSYIVVDQTGNQTIQIVGSGAGGSTTTVVGSAGDKITGSSIAANSQLIDVFGTNPTVIKGAQTVTGGAGNTTVWAGTGAVVTGGAGAITVAGNLGNNMRITAGSGNFNAFQFGTGNTVTGVFGGPGTTFIDDGYAGGGKNSLTGGSGTTTFIRGNIGDTVVGGGGSTTLTLIDGTLGSQTITGGSGFGTLIEGGKGNVIFAGTAATVLVDGLAGSQTITGGNNSTLTGANATTIWAGPADSIIGGSGALTVAGNAAAGTKITGGAGSFKAFEFGAGNSVVGSSAGTTFIDDSYGKGSINTLVGGAGATTIIAGATDSIIGGSGALEVILRSNLTGADTINLSAGSTSDGVRDDDVAGTAELGSKSTVTGFDTALDFIRSATSVVIGGGTGPGALTGAATAVFLGGNTVITFNDLSTMTVIGVTPGSIKFTQ